MFWKYGFHTAPNIDTLLDRGDATLEEVLDEEEVLQECKAHNMKLIDYLIRPNVLTHLIAYIVDVDPNDTEKAKYSCISCELLSCEVWTIIEAVTSNASMLEQLWKFLDKPAPLDSLQAAYFSKAFTTFLYKKPAEVINFLKARPDVLDKIMKHIETAAIVELLLKLIGCETVAENLGAISWLQENKVILRLIEFLDPKLDPDIHSTVTPILLDIVNFTGQPLLNPDMTPQVAPPTPLPDNTLLKELKSEAIVSKLAEFMLDNNAPNATSTLVNGITLLVEIIRRGVSELDLREPITEDDMTGLLKVLGSKISCLKELLITPRSVKGPVETAYGLLEPLGFERLKICELYAELLHCSNCFGTASEGDVNEPPKQYTLEDLNQPNVKVGAVADYVRKQFIDCSIFPLLVDMFFAFPWNNFLHTIVYDIIHQILNGPIELTKPLVFTLLRDAQLPRRICRAQRENDAESNQPRGVRRGYMGHLTFIAEQLVKFLDNNSELFKDEYKALMETEEWREYVSKTLRETIDKDRQPLGGQRPVKMISVQGYGEAGPYGNTGFGINLLNEEEDDEDMGASDQFARYLAHQLTNDLPDKFDEGSSDEDDDPSHTAKEVWMSGLIPRDQKDKTLFEHVGEEDATDSDDGAAKNNPNANQNLLTVADWNAADLKQNTSVDTEGEEGTSSSEDEEATVSSDPPPLVLSPLEGVSNATPAAEVPVPFSPELEKDLETKLRIS